LLVTAFGDRKLEPRLVCLVAQEANLGGPGLAVFELDSAPPLVHVFVLHGALKLDDVRLRDALPRVHEPLGEVAVVGGHEQPARVEVEASHGKDARGHVREQLAYGGTPLGIAHR
jgi:hypothetical protein